MLTPSKRKERKPREETLKISAKIRFIPRLISFPSLSNVKNDIVLRPPCFVSDPSEMASNLARRMIRRPPAVSSFPFFPIHFRSPNENLGSASIILFFLSGGILIGLCATSQSLIQFDAISCSFSHKLCDFPFSLFCFVIASS